MKQNYMDYETEELVVMYQSTQKEEVLQEIISRNEGLLNNWVWDYRNIPNYESEDLLEEAYIACWRAVENYSTERGVTFTTFLKVNVRQQFNRLYNEATRKKRYTGSTPVSYESLVEINKDGGDMPERAFTLNCEDYSYLEVKEFLNSLSNNAKEVAVRLMDGMSKKEIAKALEITPATISYHVGRLQIAYTNFFGVGV
jgi:RNA polymerase nonessential primary-like sigma factor